MTAVSDIQLACRWCGQLHVGVCSRVKSIEYAEDGTTVVRVEFFEPNRVKSEEIAARALLDAAMMTSRPPTVIRSDVAEAALLESQRVRRGMSPGAVAEINARMRASERVAREPFHAHQFDIATLCCVACGISRALVEEDRAYLHCRGRRLRAPDPWS